MASIQKRVGQDRKVTYRVQVRLKGYPPDTASFERLTDAKAWAAKTETDMKASRHFGISRRHTFSELMDEYEAYARQHLTKFKDRKTHLDYWRRVFKNDGLDTITTARISKERDILSTTETNRRDLATGLPIKRCGTTVKAYLAALSAALSYGVKTLQWLEKNPCANVKKPRANDGRVRFLSDEERERLLKACRESKNKDLYVAVLLALTTGARESEIMGLHWFQVDFTRRIIQLHHTKNGEKRVIPLVGEAASLLQERFKERNPLETRVFPPTARAKKATYLDLRNPWEAALKVAGIEDFHWHDLRHTAASYLAMSGVSLVEIAKVLGHRTLQMVSRYSHLSNEHIVLTGQKLAARLGVNNEKR